MNAEARFVAFTMFFAVVACTDEGSWTYHKDGTYGPRWWHSQERIDPKYQSPSDSTPESLRPFYDPGLTQALNR